MGNVSSICGRGCLVCLREGTWCHMVSLGQDLDVLKVLFKLKDLNKERPPHEKSCPVQPLFLVAFYEQWSYSGGCKSVYSGFMVICCRVHVHDVQSSFAWSIITRRSKQLWIFDTMILFCQIIGIRTSLDSDSDQTAGQDCCQLQWEAATLFWDFFV